MSLIAKKIGSSANTKKAAKASPENLLQNGFINAMKQLEALGEINPTESKSLLNEYIEELNKKNHIDPIRYIQNKKGIKDYEVMDTLIRNCKDKKPYLNWAPSNMGIAEMMEENDFLIKIIKKCKVVIVSVEESDVINIAGYSPSMVTIAHKYISSYWNKKYQIYPQVGECVINPSLFEDLYAEQTKLK
jgi:hypothetical protein